MITAEKDFEKAVEAAVENFIKFGNFDGAPKSKEPEPVVEDFKEDEEEKSMKKAGKKYSELFGWDKSILGPKDSSGKPGEADYVRGRDFTVTTYKDEDWTEEGIYYIPEESKFTDRVVDHSVMYPFVLGMQTIGDDAPDKILLVGPTGSGKSTLVEYYCAKIRQPFFRINGRQDMESDSVIGKPWVDNGSMKFEMGEIPKAMKHGWMVLFDEPWKMPSGIWMTLQRMMEHGGILQIDDMPGSLKDKQIIPDTRHRLVLADNVVGTGDNVDKYSATLIQDSSTLNRIDMVLSVPYLKEKDEVALVTKKFPLVTKERAGHMVRLLNLLRTGFDQGDLSSPASLRNIEAWAKKAIQVRSYSESFVWVLLNRYSEQSERLAVRDMFYKVFGENLPD